VLIQFFLSTILSRVRRVSTRGDYSCDIENSVIVAGGRGKGGGRGHGHGRN